ncbi:Calx-beta domain-containing protein [Arthrospira platensis NCB002]|uniref:Calx-beta domain-containing protein n=1 Tax=Limnospira platensis TaxID=118562 RepID=UPI0001D0ED73|nr:Calx-beta domain-containing protein [Arthrospira platensis NCB002]BAI94220.1 hypothetical protein NIES39_Q02120 [Arthrospira platensis NIES-39]BDT16414.1 hypothetical protein N39L_61370 [Arthrospira platensis NIES-39]
MDNTQEVSDIWWLDSQESLNPLPALGFIGDVSVEPLTAAAEIQTALTQVNQKLTEFVASASFEADLQTAFGAYTDVELGQTIIEALGEGSQLPEMIVVSADLMNGVNGGFDSLTGTVYLSDAVINSEKLVDVVTEELGHYLDSQLNEIDSPGDEGELFMRLVNGEVLSEADITGLKNQDDVVNILGGLVQVEASQDVSFSEPTNFDVGSSPYAIAVGDLNRDRKLDLAVANYSGNNVSLLLGKGDGTFDLSDTNLTVVDYPTMVAAGDLNADRNLDLVVMNGSSSSDNLTVLEGIGSASFFGDNFKTGSESGAGDFLLVDLDGDRNLDLIVMNQGYSDQISVLLGIGNGTFSKATNFNLGNNYPYAIAVGDFNGNRKLDLVVANGWSGASVLLGDGNGGFGEATMVDTGGYAYDMAAGDFNNDGNLDLVVTDHDSQAWMLLGRGDGTFRNPVGFPAGSSPQAMAVGDFNLDGNLDVAVVNSSWDGQVSVLLGRGNGTFMSPVSLAVGSYPRAITVGDFNGNGLDDLAVVNEYGSNVSILLNTTLSGSPIKPNITIRDTKIEEGDRGETNARFVVTLDSPSSERVTVNYATADGTATAGEDYRRTTGRLIFSPGQTRQIINVPVLGDTKVEPDETFRVNLSSPENAELARGQATGTILNDDDDDLPQITIADTEIREGDSGRTNARFVVRLDNPSSERVVVNYATADGTATAGEDYRPMTGRVVFSPGQTSQVINVPVLGDTKVEPDETFRVNLSRPQNATLGRRQAIGTILNDDYDDLPQITIADTEIIEGDSDRTNARFVVRLDNPSSERVVVNYATADGTATAGEDYRRTAGRVVFRPGQTRQVINVPVFGDTEVEPDETFRVNLSRPQNATLGRRQAIGTILNDDFPGDNNQQPEPPDDRFSNAVNLRTLTGEIVRTDRIGYVVGDERNTEDYYRFDLNREGTVRINLDELFANANLQLLGSDGELISQSNNGGKNPETITARKLEPGTYYVRVFPHLAARTEYRLSIDLV